MQLKAALAEISGLRYMVDKLDIKSGLAHRVLMASPFITNQEKLSYVFQQIGLTIDAIQDDEGKKILNKVSIKFSQLRDIAGTIKHIQKRVTINDIELFEIKSFALMADEIRDMLRPMEFLSHLIPDLQAVISLLDPEGSRVTSFYISSHFAPGLGDLRKKLAGIEFSIEDALINNDGQLLNQLQKQSDDLRGQITEIEDDVRQKLTEALFGFTDDLNIALHELANIDILFAKAKQSIQFQLILPDICADFTSYKGLFYPQLKDLLDSQARRYQPLDVDVYQGSCIITGANMAGKTVLLKTLALSQALCQFGFFTPALDAKIVLVDQILFSIADEQSELSGLSSFAAEMLKVDNIVKQAKKQNRLLILIDELARTTNPAEGRAIVNAVANILNGCMALSVITTHYSGLISPCRKLRVKGFIEQSESTSITVQNIGDFIDYSLIEDDGSDAPHEALRIAQILGVDNGLISEASKYMLKTLE